MSEALSGITQFISGASGQGLLKLAEAGMAGGGLIGNILNEKARSGELNTLKKNEATLADPVALAKQVSAATQPLNTGLVQSVENTVGANLAGKGLAEAPGIQAATLAQALAPFEQQNQNTALQLVLTRLGLPLDYARTFLSGLPPDTNMAPLLALLRNQNSGSSSDISGAADLDSILFPSGTTTEQPPDTTGTGYGL